jgi:thiamine pyrophosphate-dependent acetolactate synthase large subunit-like protein
MMLQELSTMLQYDTPVKIINLNNGYLGMVRQWQEFFYEKRYAMSYIHWKYIFTWVSQNVNKHGTVFLFECFNQGRL